MKNEIQVENVSSLFDAKEYKMTPRKMRDRMFALYQSLGYDFAMIIELGDGGTILVTVDGADVNDYSNFMKEFDRVMKKKK